MKDQQAILKETEKGNPPMMTREEDILKEETEVCHMKKEDTEGTEVTAETEETTTMEAAGPGCEETAGKVSVSEGLL